MGWRRPSNICDSKTRSSSAAISRQRPNRFRGSLNGTLDQQNLLVVVDLLELDLDNLAAAGGHMLANVSGLDGQFAVAAVDEHSQLHAARPALVEERIERGADSAAGEEHIVAENHIAALDVDADGSRRDHGPNVRRG